MTSDPLAPLLTLPGVREAVDAARTACEELRWHEAFRRRSAEVRAEAGLRAARASAALDGARLPLEAVREMAVGLDPARGGDVRQPGDDHAADVVRGALQAQAMVEARMPALGARSTPALPPFGQLLAAVHSAATAGWLAPDDVGRLRTVDQPLDLRGLGAAPTGPEVAARMELLGQVAWGSRAPALLVAGVVHGELLAVRPFAAGNGVVARAMSRLLLTTGGLDPTGTVLPEIGWAANPNPYLAAAAMFAVGAPDGPDGVVAWLVGCAAAVQAGAREAGLVADAVLAGTLS